MTNFPPWRIPFVTGKSKRERICHQWHHIFRAKFSKNIAHMSLRKIKNSFKENECYKKRRRKAQKKFERKVCVFSSFCLWEIFIGISFRPAYLSHLFFEFNYLQLKASYMHPYPLPLPLPLFLLFIDKIDIYKLTV